MDTNGKIKKSENFRVTDPTKPVKLYHSPEDIQNFVTIPDVFKEIATNYGDLPALMHKDPQTGEWIKITYKEYRERVEKLAKVFIKLGLRKFGVVAVLAGNCVEWFLTELAVIHAGGIVTGIYQTNSADACHHILDLTKAQFVVVDDDQQMQKIKQIRHKLPLLEQVIQISASENENEDFIKWSELSHVDTDDVEEEYEKRFSEIAVNECCCIVFTSGTTGNPKGAMMSHDNFMFMAHFKAEELVFGEERFVSYLPLAHMAAQIYELLRSIAWAACVYFGSKDAIRGSVLDLFVEVRPTAFSGIPRIFEKLRARIEKLKSRVGFELDTDFNVNRIRKELGIDKIKRFGSGSAPMDFEMKKFLKRYRIRIMDTAGQTETTGTYTRSVLNTVNDSVGSAITGVEVKISNPDETGNGEICVRGRCVFMGYLHDEKQTAEAFDDEGWFKTGDIGALDEFNNLRITGRIKELVITSGGKNIPPLIIEGKVKSECPAVSQAFLVGDRRKFLTMLITLKTQLNADGTSTDELAAETVEWLKLKNLKHSKLSEAMEDPAVVSEIQELINKVNDSASSNPEKIQKFAILPNDFSVSTGELTSSLKVKRNFVLEKYQNVIDKFYV